MARVDGSLQSLLQGVSQQPARERLPGQCAAQLNMTSDPVTGLTRRPPTERIATLMTEQPDSHWFMHVIDGVERYFVCVYAGEIRVFSEDGTEQTVNAHTNGDYLTGSSVSTVTLDKSTYIADNSVVPAMLDDTREYDEGAALVFLLGGQYGRDYTITINYTDAMDVDQEISITHTTPDGSLSAHTQQVATEYIANEIETDLNALPEFPGTFKVVRKSDVLHIRWADDDKFDRFDVTVEDGDGGANIFSITDATSDVSKIPRFAPHKYVVKIAGADASEDDFWLEFRVTSIDEDDTITDGRGDGFGKEGLWIETVSPDIEYKFDLETMPHTLTKEDDDTFTFAQVEWEDRRVGNDDSNPIPSFVGTPILDITSFQNRLTFCGGGTVVMSRASKPTDFWSRSATVQADDDPIDIGSTSQEASVMRRMVPHNRDLVVWSDGAEFIVFGRDSLTPKNASLVLTTTFEVDLTADPVSTGRNVFFATNVGRFTGISEFYTESGSDTNNSRTVTSHVSRYILGSPMQLEATSNFSKLLVLTDTDASLVFVYEYLWQDDTKAQSAWSTWQFPFNVRFMKFVENVVYIIGDDGTDFILEKLDLDVTDDVGVPFQNKIDRKTKIEGVTTSITAPYDVDMETVKVVQGEGCPNPGMLANVTDITGRDITLRGDCAGGDVYLGIKYLSSFTPTPPRVKDRDGVEVSTGTLVIRNYLVNYTNTGHLNGTVKNDYRDDFTVVFSGRVVGALDNKVGVQPVVDGSLQIMVGEENDEAEMILWSDSHTPATLLDIEWEGQYNKRGRRITGGGA